MPGDDSIAPSFILPSFSDNLLKNLTFQSPAGRRYENSIFNHSPGAFFYSIIQKETIKGWGFPRYIVSELGPMAGTLMAIDSSAPKVNRFISLDGEPYLIRYNSRLPIVIYAPEGVKVRYRIWSAGSVSEVIEEN